MMIAQAKIEEARLFVQPEFDLHCKLSETLLEFGGALPYLCVENDFVWGEARNISDVPAVFVERLEHYFVTYKLVPGEKPRARVAKTYGRAHACRVVRAAMKDYEDNFAL